MSRPARVVDVADAAARAILDAWNASGSPPGADDAVIRTYSPTVGLNPEQPDTLTAGRKVFVVPPGYATPGMADRGTLWLTHTVGVLIVERYTGGPGPPPDDWVDARVAFVEQVVFATLRNPGLVLTGAVVQGAYPDLDDLAAVVVAYDGDVLRDQGAFWSQAAFTFRDLTDLRGD